MCERSHNPYIYFRSSRLLHDRGDAEMSWVLNVGSINGTQCGLVPIGSAGDATANRRIKEGARTSLSPHRGTGSCPHSLSLPQRARRQHALLSKEMNLKVSPQMSLLQGLYHDQEGAETDRYVPTKILEEIMVNMTLFLFSL